MAVKGLTFWILGAASGCFLAGFNVGLATPDIMAAAAPTVQDQDELFVRQIVADYGLDKKQERSLRFVMQRLRTDEVQIFRRAEFSMLPSSIQNQLLRVREQQKARIRAILDDDQRARYDLATKPK